MRLDRTISSSDFLTYFKTTLNDRSKELLGLANCFLLTTRSLMIMLSKINPGKMHLAGFYIDHIIGTRSYSLYDIDHTISYRLFYMMSIESMKLLKNVLFEAYNIKHLLLFFQILNLLIRYYTGQIIYGMWYTVYHIHYFEISMVSHNWFSNSISGCEFHAWESNKLNNI